MILIIEIAFGLVLGIVFLNLFIGASNVVNYGPTQTYYHRPQFSESDKSTISIEEISDTK